VSGVLACALVFQVLNLLSLGMLGSFTGALLSEGYDKVVDLKRALAIKLRRLAKGSQGKPSAHHAAS
jgi:hypothetical protein